VIVAGAKSENRARRAVSKLVEELKKGGIVILGKPDVTIRNVVASADLKHRIDLEDTANSLEGTIYEPDQFPGLIYRLKEPKVAILIFASGKLVCAGASCRVDVEKAVNGLSETLAVKGLIPLRESTLR
jgi:transcription initiation factor TFIID TATA-box-binding protein